MLSCILAPLSSAMGDPARRWGPRLDRQCHIKSVAHLYTPSTVGTKTRRLLGSAGDMSGQSMSPKLKVKPYLEGLRQRVTGLASTSGLQLCSHKRTPPPTSCRCTLHQRCSPTNIHTSTEWDRQIEIEKNRDRQRKRDREALAKSSYLRFELHRLQNFESIMFVYYKLPSLRNSVITEIQLILREKKHSESYLNYFIPTKICVL